MKYYIVDYRTSKTVVKQGFETRDEAEKYKLKFLQKKIEEKAIFNNLLTVIQK